MTLNIRVAVEEDAAHCGRIIYNAFHKIATEHGFSPDVPSPEMATELVKHHVNHPKFFGVVAEIDGVIVGSNFLDERDSIVAVGPITVDPESQARGVGRKLMQAVIDRGQGAADIRLMQDAFNVVSMSLYESLGFNVTEPLLLMSGKTKDAPPSGFEVRPMKAEDLPACNELCKQVLGFDRQNEVAEALEFLTPFVAIRDGQIRAYATSVNFWIANHGVAETDEDMFALLSGASIVTSDPLSFLIPTRRSAFFRWALQQGFRAINPRTLMAMKPYVEPKGCFFPSVLY